MNRRAEYRIHGMDCAEEVSLLRRRLSRVEGIFDLAFDIFSGKMTVEFNPEMTSTAAIAEAITSTGMASEPWSVAPSVDSSFWRRHRPALLTASSGGLLLAGLTLASLRGGNFLEALLAHGHATANSHPAEPYVLGLYLVSILCGLHGAGPRAARAILRLRLDMDVLVSAAAAGALILGQWVEGATLAFLYGLSEWLENRSHLRVRHAVTGLLNVVPAEAVIIHEHGETTVSADRIAVGTLVRVLPEHRIPCDGIVHAGRSRVDQALLTGESVPVRKATGDMVYAGTLNREGALEVRASRSASDTTLARVLRMIESSQQRRAPSERFIDRFAFRYTPAMFAAALLVAVLPPLFQGRPWTEGFYRGMLVLLISCPCALVISTPVSIYAALASAARRGVLIKGGAFLEEASRLRAFAFEKNGVLTAGNPLVTKVEGWAGRNPDAVLGIAAGLALRTADPGCRAILHYAASRHVEPDRIDDFRSLSDRGVEGMWNGCRAWLVNPWLPPFAPSNTGEWKPFLERLQKTENSVLACGVNEELWGLLLLHDPLRPEAATAISALRGAGIREVAVVTSDGPASARAAARGGGVSREHSALNAEGKAAILESLRRDHRHVAMVASGPQDAPALQAASLGIALGTSGDDLAIDAADIVILTPDLGRLPFLLRHAQRAMNLIRQNVALALVLKLSFLILMFMDQATLWMAIAADTGATLLVTFNGMRLLRADSE